MDEASDILKDRIVPIDIEKINGISDLLRGFNATSFQSRNLARCVEIYVDMLKDPDDPTIFLGLAGAMIPAGMKKVISVMIRRGMVDVIVTTGANAYHDLVEALGYYHYKGSPHVDDKKLYNLGIDRIYDTFASEKEYREVDDRIAALADELMIKNPELSAISSRRFMEELGKLIDKEGVNEEKKDSFIWNAWQHEVPIFVPALCDSSIGIALTKHHILSRKKGLKPLMIDHLKDNYEIYRIKKSSKKTGVIYIGGGVPKDFTQLLAVSLSLKMKDQKIPERRGFARDATGEYYYQHKYAIQITTDSPQWGGLSGCTLEEAISWGKSLVRGKELLVTVMNYCLASYSPCT